MTARSVVSQADVEAVYEAIYAQLRAEQTLPLKQELAERLRMELSYVNGCLARLRWQGRIEPFTLLPSDYRLHWREMPVIRDGAETMGIPLRQTRHTDLIEQ